MIEQLPLVISENFKRNFQNIEYFFHCIPEKKCLSVDYNYKLFSCILLFLFFSSNMYAQIIQISGTILNKEMKTPISMVHIFTKDRSLGTISTSEGNFTINIPVNQSDKYIYFSNISYETDSLLISQMKISPTIYLMPKIYALKEVIVMPDSTLLTLLRKAYSKIPDNYPNKPTRYTGFYQETTSEKNNLVKLVEAELSVYKESYMKKKEAPGQVEILKSRIKQFQSSNFGYVGGVFISIEEDIVLQREKFIQPQYFKNYRYNLNGIISLNEKDCYEIAFFSLDKDSVTQGIVLIDTESLAYMAFEKTSIRPENATTIVGITKPVETKLKTEYEQINGICYLKYVSLRAVHEHWRIKNPRNTSYDFFTTQIQTDSVKPIPVEKRLKYMEPIEVITDEYNKKGWIDSDILANENPEQFRFQFSTDEAYSIFNKNVQYRKSFASKLINTMPKLVAGYGIHYNSKYKLAVSQQIIGYRLDKKWSVQLFYSENLYDKKRISLKETSFGIEYRKNLNNISYPFFFETSLWVSHNNIQRKNHNRILEQSITPQISITKQMSKFFTFEFFVNYPLIVFSNTDINNNYLRAGLNLYFLY